MCCIVIVIIVTVVIVVVLVIVIVIIIIIIFDSIISDPQIAVKFMAKQHKYERLKDFRLGSVFRQLFGHAVGTASGEAHKRIRSTFDRCYGAESVSQSVDMMEQECKQYLRLIVEERKVSWNNS